MMFLVLTHADDPTALAVYNELCSRHGADRVALLTDMDLTVWTGWSYQHEYNHTKTTLRLRDGRQFSSGEITSVFNRLSYLNGAHFAGFEARDRDYAVGEMFAFLMSWLTSLSCPVVNPASVRGLGFSNRTFLEWFKLAGEAGLPTRNARFTTDARLLSPNGSVALQPLAGMTLGQLGQYSPTSVVTAGNGPTVWLEPILDETQRVLVIGDEAHGKLDELAEPCLKFAKRVNASLVELTFVRSVRPSNDGWRCGWVNASPQLNRSEVSVVTNLLEGG